MGDILWYIASLDWTGLKFSEIAKYNLEKLAKRQKENKIHGSGDNR